MSVRLQAGPAGAEAALKPQVVQARHPILSVQDVPAVGVAPLRAAHMYTVMSLHLLTCADLRVLGFAAICTRHRLLTSQEQHAASMC